MTEIEIEMFEAGQKLIGILSNIRHEIDYLPDSYYDWIDKVLNETEDVFTTKDANNG